MAKLSFLEFLKTQLFTTLPLTKTDLTGKTVIVTGANVGLGKETAKHLAAMNPERLILACRNVEMGQEAAREIPRVSGVSIDVWQLDLADFASVKAFAARVESLERLDILIENAGIATETFRRTKDGNESTLQVNVLATTMLAMLSLPKMRETVKKYHVRPRLVLVGSEVHFWSVFKEHTADEILAALNDESKFVPSDRYNTSKLLDVMVTRELGNLLKASKVKEDHEIDVNCPNPGLCHSSLSREAGFGLYILKLLFARTTEEGARVFVWAATAKQDNPGEYISACQFAEPSDFTISETGRKTQKRVWAEIQQVLKKECPQMISL